MSISADAFTKFRQAMLSPVASNGTEEGAAPPTSTPTSTTECGKDFSHHGNLPPFLCGGECNPSAPAPVPGEEAGSVSTVAASVEGGDGGVASGKARSSASNSSSYGTHKPVILRPSHAPSSVCGSEAMHTTAHPTPAYQQMQAQSFHHQQQMLQNVGTQPQLAVYYQQPQVTTYVQAPHHHQYQQQQQQQQVAQQQQLAPQYQQQQPATTAHSATYQHPQQQQQQVVYYTVAQQQAGSQSQYVTPSATPAATTVQYQQQQQQSAPLVQYQQVQQTVQQPQQQQAVQQQVIYTTQGPVVYQQATGQQQLYYIYYQ